jgi:hypothetical protein
MENFVIEDIKFPKYTISTVCEDDSIKISVEGSIEDAHPDEVLIPFFDNIHDKALKYNIKNIVIDVYKLRFINSNGLKLFIYWILKTRSLKFNEVYFLNLLCAKEYHWQYGNFKILEAISPKYFKITVME